MLTTSSKTQDGKLISINNTAVLHQCKEGDFVVLATGEGSTASCFSGVVVHTDGTWKLGYLASVWYREAFKPYKGKITLKTHKAAK
jgi:hypothetical protein